MRVSYSDGYVIPLPPGHPFPMQKFSLLHQYLLDEGLLERQHVVKPRQADWSDLLQVHSTEYLSGLAAGTLSREAIRKMGFPWSPALVRRSRLAVQGTINAALMALEDGIAANLAGGTHHAFPDHGEGFCVLNDVAVAIRVLEQSKWIRRSLVIDLDVHQGNGTAAIFAEDEDTFTFSLHGAKNYPFEKPASSLDVALPDRTTDTAYLERLRRALPGALRQSRPDIVFYLAGIDVVDGDRFGRLSLTTSGLEQRDRFVLQTIRDSGIPLVLLLSGGYAETPLKTANLHATAHHAARAIYG